MNGLTSWLGKDYPRKSKFINHRLDIGGKFTGIYKAVRRTKNKYGKTLHFIFYDPDGGLELIFDTNNHKHAEVFQHSSFGSRIEIRKVFKNGRPQYEVEYLNSLEDEAARLPRREEGRGRDKEMEMEEEKET